MSIANSMKENEIPVRGTPVFICGHPRSGTTLLKSLLDGHSDFLVFPEDTGYLARIAKRPELVPEDGLVWLLDESGCRKLDLEDDEGWRDYSKFDFDAFREQVWLEFRTGKLTHRRALESIMIAYGQQIGQGEKRYWLEKTPGNENHLFLASQWFSEVRALCLVRDPRDVYASYKRKREHEGKALSLQSFICRWGTGVWAWQQWVARNPGGLTIRYEDLVRYPRETLSVICRFLRVGYRMKLERPTLQGNNWVGGSSFSNEFSEISTKPIGRRSVLATAGRLPGPSTPQHSGCPVSIARGSK